MLLLFDGDGTSAEALVSVVNPIQSNTCHGDDIVYGSSSIAVAA